MPGTRVYTRAGRRPDPGAGHDGENRLSVIGKRASHLESKFVAL